MEYKIDFKSNKTAACGGGLLGGREHRGHVEMYSPPREREPQQVPPQAKGRCPDHGHLPWARVCPILSRAQ